MQQPKDPLRSIYNDLGLEKGGVAYDKFVETFNSNPEARKSIYNDLGLESAGVDYNTFESRTIKKKDLSQQDSASGSETSTEPLQTSQGSVDEAGSLAAVQEVNPGLDLSSGLGLNTSQGGLGSSLTTAPTMGETVNNARYGEPAEIARTQRLQGYLQSYVEANDIQSAEGLAQETYRPTIGGEQPGSKDGGFLASTASGFLDMAAGVYEIPRLLYDFTGAGGVVPYDSFLKALPNTVQGNPLVAMDVLAKQQSAEGDYYAQKVRQYEDGIFESIKKGNFSSTGNQLINTFGGSIGGIASMFMSGGAANALKLGNVGKNLVMAAPFASNKNAELANDDSVPYYLKPTLSILYGLAETVPEQSFGTKAVLDGIFDIAKNEGREAAVKAGVKILTSFRDKAIKRIGPARNIVTGSGSEAMTTFIQNVLDRKENLMEGVPDAAIAGGFIDTSLGGVGSGMKAIYSRKERTDIEKLSKDNDGMVKSLENIDLTDQERETIFSIIENNNTKIGKYLDNAESKRGKLEPKQKSLFDALQERNDVLETLKNKPGVSDGTRAALQTQQDSNSEVVEALVEATEVTTDGKKKPSTAFPEISQLPQELGADLTNKIERWQDLTNQFDNPELDDAQRGAINIEKNQVLEEINGLVDQAKSLTPEELSPLPEVSSPAEVESAVTGPEIVPEPEITPEPIQEVSVPEETNIEPIEEGGQDANEEQIAAQVDVQESPGDGETVDEGNQEPKKAARKSKGQGQKEVVPPVPKPKPFNKNDLIKARREVKELEAISPDEITYARSIELAEKPKDKAHFQAKLDAAKKDRIEKLAEKKEEVRRLQLTEAGLDPNTPLVNNDPIEDNENEYDKELERDTPEKLASKYHEEASSPTILEGDLQKVFDYGNFGVTRSSFVDATSEATARDINGRMWFVNKSNSTGAGISGLASYMGVDIETVVEFIMMFPNGPNTVTTPSGNPKLRAINDAYFAKTGRKLNRKTAKEISDKLAVSEDRVNEAIDPNNELLKEAWSEVRPFDADRSTPADNGHILNNFDRVESLLKFLGKTAEEIQTLKDYLEYEQAQNEDIEQSGQEVDIDRQQTRVFEQSGGLDAESEGLEGEELTRDEVISNKAQAEANDISAQTTGRNADTVGKMRAYGFNEPLPYKKVTHKELIEEAKNELATGYDVDILVARVDAGAAITDLETVILSQYVAAKEAEFIVLTQDLEGRLRDADGVTFNIAANKRDRARQDLLKAYDALIRGGRVNARALNARKALVYRDRSLANMIDVRRRATGNSALTPLQLADVQDKFSKLERAYEQQSEALAKAQEAAALQAIENMALRERKANTRAEGTRNRSAKRADRKEAAKERIASIKDKIKAIELASRGQLSSTPIKPEVVPHLLSLVKEYVTLGAITAEEIVDRVYTDVSGIIEGVTKKDIRDAISGYGQAKDTRKKRSDIEQRISDVKREMKLLSMIEDEQAGLKKEKNPVDKEIKSQRIKDLEAALKKVRAENNKKTDAELLQLEKDRVSKRIQLLQAQIQENDNDKIDNKKPRLTDPELEALKAEEKALLKERRALEDTNQENITDKQRDGYIQRLADDIADINEQIENGVRKRKDKTGRYPDDQEIAALRREKQERMDVLNSVDPSYEQEIRERAAIAATERSIKELEDRLAKDRLLPDKTKAAVTNSRLRDLKKKRDDLRKQLEYRQKQALAEGNPEMVEAVTKQRVESTKRRLDKLREAIKEGRYRNEAQDVLPQSEELKKINKEIRDVTRAYHLENARLELKNRTTKQKWIDGAIEVLAIPRQIMSSVDLSAIFRQGAFLLSRPKTAAGAFKMGLKFWWSQDKYDAWNQQIQNSPGYELMRAAGLELTDTNKGVKQEAREEMFQSRLLQMLPLLGETRTIWGVKTPGINIFSKSERNYSGTLNVLRTQVFSKGVELLQQNGYDTVNNMDAYKALAKYVNIVTGRGDMLGMEDLKVAAPLLSHLLFAPRFMMSRVEFLTAYPALMKGSNNVIRQMYARDLAGYLGFGALMISFANMMGAMFQEDDEEDNVTVSMDPASTDFGKIKVGDTRIDVWAGSQQLVVMAYRAIAEEYSTVSGRTTKLDGSSYDGKTPGDILARFGRSKLSPLAGYFVSASLKENYMGERFEAFPEFVNIMLPMGPSNMYENFRDMDSKAFATVASVATILGGSVQTYRTNDFLAKGIDDKIIDLLAKNQTLIQDPEKKRIQIYDKKTGEKRWMKDAEYKKYGNTYLDHIKTQLEVQYDELSKLPKVQFNAKMNGIKGEATRKAQLSVSGITNTMTRITSGEKKFILNPEQLATRSQIKSGYIQDNQYRYDALYEKYISQGMVEEEARLKSQELAEKQSDRYSASRMLEMNRLGEITLSEEETEN